MEVCQKTACMTRPSPMRNTCVSADGRLRDLHHRRASLAHGDRKATFSMRNLTIHGTLGGRKNVAPSRSLWTNFPVS